MPKISPQYRDQRRAQVLAAARRCFEGNGFHQTSMQDLVREAGMSSGAIYRYFESKDAMIVAIAEENLDQVVQVVRESAAAGASAAEALASTLEYVSGRHADDGFGAIALLVWSEALRSPALALRLRASLAATTDALADAAPARSATGAQPSPDLLASMLMCVLPGFLLQLTIRGGDAVRAIPDAVRSLQPVDDGSQRGQ